MTYANCPRCRLTIRVRAENVAPRHCPRCLARARMAVPMYTTEQPIRLDPRDALVPEPPATHAA